MIVYRDTIERARGEYRSLKLKYDGLEELLTTTKKTLHKVMNEKIDTDADYGF
jgi:undecaprenyl pyrophosphate synthase